MEKILKNKKMLVIVLIIILLIVGCIFIFGKGKTKTKKKEEDVIIKDNINTPRNTKGFEISNINVIKEEGKITLEADLLNVAKRDFSDLTAYVIILNEHAKEIGKIETRIYPVLNGEKTKISVDITEYYDDMRDFKLDVKMPD